MIASLFVSFFLQAPAQNAPATPAPATPAPAAEEQWVADYDEAAKLAKAQGKDILVDFTGSDWCIWCKRLHDEVFKFDEFLTAAKANYILCALDFPNSDEAKAKVPHPERNAELMKQHKIRGYPTILLITADGQVYGKTGYQPGGAEPYVKHLSELRESGTKKLAEITDQAAKFAAAKGDEKTKLLDAAIEQLSTLDGDSPFGGAIAAIVRNAYELDKDNAQGRKEKAVTAILKAGEQNDADVTVANALDPKNEKGLRERVVFADLMTVSSKETAAAWMKEFDTLDALGALKDKEIAQQMYFTAARWCLQVFQQPDAAKKYAQKCKDLGVDANPQLAQALEQILGS